MSLVTRDWHLVPLARPVASLPALVSMPGEPLAVVPLAFATTMSTTTARRERGRHLEELVVAALLIFPRFALGLTDRPIAEMPAYLAGSSSSSTDDDSHMYTFLDAVGAANNTCFGNPPCDPDCRHCDAYTHQCECLRWHINVPAKCKCPRLSSETLVAVGAVRRVLVHVPHHPPVRAHLLVEQQVEMSRSSDS